MGRGTKFSQWTANIWTIWTNQTYSTDGLFRAQYTFLVAGGEWTDDDYDDDGNYDYGDDVYWLLMSDRVDDMGSCRPVIASSVQAMPLLSHSPALALSQAGVQHSFCSI